MHMHMSAAHGAIFADSDLPAKLSCNIRRTQLALVKTTDALQKHVGGLFRLLPTPRER